MFTPVAKFWRDERASVATEYAILATGIAFVIISAVAGLGTKLGTYFVQVSGAIK